MNQARTVPSHVLVLHLVGPAKAQAQLKTSALFKAFTRALDGATPSLCCTAPWEDGVDVVFDVHGLSLLHLREAWAKGLLGSHQGLRAVRLDVLDGTGGRVSQRRDLDDLRTIVTLRRD
ncbi:MAG: hypothetical protein H6733_03685 [Alphaproteobacteria bacterium]|nr:hypothetical protein [Alphaproteobacteria bacterium]